jgi:hypothetical protein
VPRSTKLTPSQAGRLGGIANAARNDPREYIARARRDLEARHANDVDPSGELRQSDPAEFPRRYEARRREFFQRLSHAGVAARRRAASG